MFLFCNEIKLVLFVLKNNPEITELEKSESTELCNQDLQNAYKVNIKKVVNK